MTNRRIYPNRIYRHFKGKYYFVLGVAIHADTGEDCVVYRSLYGNCLLYIRPLDEFLSPTDKKKYPNATQENRFELVGDDEALTVVKNEG